MPAITNASHAPVLLESVLVALAPRDDEVMTDATFGVGGYSRALLEAARCTVWAIDRDPDALVRAEAMVGAYRGRFGVLDGSFANMESLLARVGVSAIDGVAFDLGVSSPQLDDSARGFSFQVDGPLDMRMSRQGPTAADFVNTADETTLANVIFRYGEERNARRIARAIVRRRAERPISRTLDFAGLVAANARGKPGPQRIHPATRTFQALRIYLNDELDELRRGLAAAERLLRVGGRIVVVAFHSLEDRIVKDFLTERSGRAPRPGRHQPAVATRPATFVQPARKALRPTEVELERNPRARSARLRSAVRTSSPAWAPVGTSS
ncbi:MAG: 16S rRNA (cytosine(1402)-N(4))-methyltransferase RsmH [Alphaproteobacteria bacterium]|nr:16S rRNA (cytosine(1402)-N(4))-methyltransferase RsmH [Alphaproteobacteria bacterium]